MLLLDLPNFGPLSLLSPDTLNPQLLSNLFSKPFFLWKPWKCHPFTDAVFISFHLSLFFLLFSLSVFQTGVCFWSLKMWHCLVKSSINTVYYSIWLDHLLVSRVFCWTGHHWNGLLWKFYRRLWTFCGHGHPLMFSDGFAFGKIISQVSDGLTWNWEQISRVLRARIVRIQWSSDNQEVDICFKLNVSTAAVISHRSTNFVKIYDTLVHSDVLTVAC